MVVEVANLKDQMVVGGGLEELRQLRREVEDLWERRFLLGKIPCSHVS